MTDRIPNMVVGCFPSGVEISDEPDEVDVLDAGDVVEGFAGEVQVDRAGSAICDCPRCCIKSIQFG